MIELDNHPVAYGPKLDPARKHRNHGKFPGDRQIVRLTNNPSTINPGETISFK